MKKQFGVNFKVSYKFELYRQSELRRKHNQVLYSNYYIKTVSNYYYLILARCNNLSPDHLKTMESWRYYFINTEQQEVLVQSVMSSSLL